MKNSKDEDTIQTASNANSDAERLTQLREWVVKSNSKILGPFSHEEVSQQLRDNRLVPHDEVISPKGRWKLLRQEEKFRDVLNEIRNRAATRMDKIMDSTVAESITLNEGTHPINLDDSFRNSQRLTEGMESQTRSNSTSSEPSSETRDLVKSYGYSGDARVKKKLGRTENVKITLALVIFFMACIASVMKFSKKTEGPSSRGDSFADLLVEGTAAEKVGDYSKALAIYSEARNLKPNDNELLFRLAPLTFIYEKQSLQASRIFKQLLETDKNESHKKAALMGQGLVALDSHELDIAMDNFSKVLLMESQNLAATFNIGVVNFYRDKFEDAELFLRKALEKGGNDGAVVISMADVNMASGEEAGGGRSRLNAAHEMMKAYLDVSYDYRPQVLIQDAHVLAMLGRTNEALKSLEAVLDLDPEQVDMFLRDWQIYRGRASWDQSLATLKRTLPSVNPGPRMTALEGFVMYQGREKLEGAQNIEKALSQSPKDPLLMALTGWVEMKLGRREAAVTNIKEAALMNSPHRLPKILRARLCVEEKDYGCAQKNWEEILKTDQKNLSAYHGLAWLEWQRKDGTAAVRWLRQGQAMDSKYIPFNILNAEIEAATADSKP